MALEIKSGGKTIAVTDCEEEIVIVNGQKRKLSDVYQNKELRDEFNTEIINNSQDINDDK